MFGTEVSIYGFTSSSSSLDTTPQWFSSFDPILHNQYSTKSRSINFFFKISFWFSLFLLLYILTFFMFTNQTLELLQTQSMAMKPNGKSPITSEDLSRRYFHQLISAVGYRHSRGVFHWDLKFHIISRSPCFNLSGMFSGEYDRVERLLSGWTAARVLQHRSYRLLDSCNESFFQVWITMFGLKKPLESLSKHHKPSSSASASKSNPFDSDDESDGNKNHTLKPSNKISPQPSLPTTKKNHSFNPFDDADDEEEVEKRLKPSFKNHFRESGLSVTWRRIPVP